MTRTMKAVVKTHEMGPGAELRTVPVPQVGPGEVLIKIEFAPICGSDKIRYYWKPGDGEPAFVSPVIMGHEMSGVVREVGAGVKRVKPGDRVACETHIPCGHCHQCLTGSQHVCQNLEVFGVHRNGCFAEYIALPECCPVPIPDSLPLDQAALLEPAGVANHALSKVTVGGNSVMIVGCGPIGLMAVRLAHLYGAARVIAVAKRPRQQEMARKLGADLVLSPDRAEIAEAVGRVSAGHGVGAVIELTGTESGVLTAFESVRKAGEVVLTGTTVPMMFDFQKLLNNKELTVHGQHGRRMYRDWVELLALIDSGRLDLAPFITAKFPLAEYAEGFTAADRPDQIKVLLTC